MDRENVINDFESCIKIGGWNHCKSCEHSESSDLRLVCKQMAEEVLALLKEQTEIVRCKDCKHRNKEIVPDGAWEGYVFCKKDCAGRKKEWFCADGEREEGLT